MELDRLVGHPEDLRYLPVRAALGHEPEDLQLAARQPFAARDAWSVGPVSSSCAP